MANKPGPALKYPEKLNVKITKEMKEDLAIVANAWSKSEGANYEVSDVVRIFLKAGLDGKFSPPSVL